MARAALGFTAEELAKRAALEAGTVAMLEAGSAGPDHEAKIRTTLEGLGVEFIGEDGVRFHDAGPSAAVSVSVEQLNSANDE